MDDSVIRRMTFLLACTAVAGCGDGSPPAPDTAAARYELARSARDTLPLVLEQADGCRVILTGGRVEFLADARYRSIFDIERRCANAPPEAVRDPGGVGTVRIAGDTAFFADTAGHPAGSGVLTGDSLVVQGRLHTLIYRRAPLGH